jgi:hypothetical protein
MTYKCPGDEKQPNNWFNPVTFKPYGYVDYIDLRDKGFETLVSTDGERREWSFDTAAVGFMKECYSISGDQRTMDIMMEELAVLLIEYGLVMQPWSSVTIRGTVMMFFTDKKDLTKLLFIGDPVLGKIPDAE